MKWKLQMSPKTKTTVFLFGIIIVLMIALSVLSRMLKEMFQVPQYLHHKSKCFDCEAQIANQFGTDAIWMANPSKTFAAERDGIAQAGGDISGGFLGKTMRYY